MESASALASASLTAVPSFSFFPSQERYDSESCQDVTCNICQGADVAVEVIQNFLEASLLHYYLLSRFWKKKIR